MHQVGGRSQRHLCTRDTQKKQTNKKVGLCSHWRGCHLDFSAHPAQTPCRQASLLAHWPVTCSSPGFPRVPWGSHRFKGLGAVSPVEHRRDTAEGPDPAAVKVATWGAKRDKSNQALTGAWEYSWTPMQRGTQIAAVLDLWQLSPQFPLLSETVSSEAVSKEKQSLLYSFP